MPLIHCVYPKILHKHCFLFVLGITVVSEELENNAYAKIPGRGGRLVNGVYVKM